MMEINTYPLTSAQKSILIIEQFHSQAIYNNIAATVHLKGDISYECLNQAVNLLIEQNDGLRIQLSNLDNQIVQYFTEYIPNDIELFDFSYPNALDDFNKWLNEKNHTPLEFYNSRLYFFALIKFSEDKYGMYIKCHHIVCDFWSIMLLVNQVLDSYLCLLQGSEVQKKNYSYIDFISKEQKYLTSARFDQDKVYWDNKIENLISPNLFEKRQNNSLQANRKHHALSNLTFESINQFCLENQISPFILFVSAFTIYFWRKHDRETLAIGTTVLNRTSIQDKRTFGAFFNNLPFIIQVNSSLNFKGFLLYLNSEWMELIRHSSFPYVNILKSYREIHKTKNELFDFTLTFLNTRLNQIEIPIEFEGYFNGQEVNALRLNIADLENKGTLVLGYDYSIDILNESEIDEMNKCISNLIQNCIKNPSCNIGELSMFSEKDKHLIINGFNRTDMHYPSDKTILDQFHIQVEKTPDQVAVAFEDKTLTYSEIDQKSNQLARYLMQKGVHKEEIVGFCAERSMDIVVGILGIIKAGAAYLPIDPSYPDDRIDYMLKDSGCRFLVTNTDIVLNGYDIEIIYLQNSEIRSVTSVNIGNHVNPGDLAYVMYTSGSTGLPKGVMIEHRSLQNFVYAITQKIKFNYNCILSLTTMSFDIFFVETIMPLLLGMKVVIANTDEYENPNKLFDLIARHQIDIIQTTPSRMGTMIKNSSQCMDTLSVILIGGEAFPEALLKELKKVTKAQIYNMYGPTETTIWSSIKRLEETDQITIGTPIGNTQIYLLDEFMNPVPIGMVGEIYIAGDGLARGYWNRPGLTNDRFITNPMIPGTKMYKTGDLARYQSNGEIVYIGRNDTQIKFKGYRIELGEIEAHLKRHESIDQAVVICSTSSERPTIVAYYTGKVEIPVPELRSYLTKFLPDYMIPNRFIWLTSLPTSLNGKIDRKALLNPTIPSTTSEIPYVPPQDETQRKLAEVWCKVLGVPVVGIDDNFFVLGGDSLAILEILSSTYTNSWKISAQDFYEYSTIRNLSELIDNRLDKDRKKKKISNIALDIRELNNKLKQQRVLEGDVLLTGVTGFLGIHILLELLKEHNGKIYCLVRGDHYEKKFYDYVKYYEPNISNKDIQDKVVLVNADITHDKFGLSESEYLLLAERVDSVIHSAALVKHFGAYSEFEKTNVQGTREVINFCYKFDKHLSFISTTSVSGNFTDTKEVSLSFSEEDLYIGQDYDSNVYVKSKFESEKIILQMAQKGLRTTIFRVGILTGRYRDGLFQYNIEENAFYRRLRSIIAIGVIPEDILDEYIEFTPVDFCANAIVKILNSPQNMLVYHIYNHNRIMVKELIHTLENHGIRILPTTNNEFSTTIKNLLSTDKSKEITGIVQDLVTFGSLNFSSMVEVNSSQTVHALNQVEFEWPVLTSEYIGKVIQHMRKVDFLGQERGII